MISGLYIVTPILRQIAKDERVTIYFLGLGVVFVYVAETLNLFPLIIRNKFLAISNQLNVQLVGGFSCYFLWGYWLSRHILSPIARKTIYIMGLLAAIGTVVINGLAGYYFNVTGEWMYNYLLPNVLMMSTAVFVFCQYNFQCGELSAKWQSRIGLIGKWSFGVYLVHAFFLSNMYRIGLPHFFCHPLVSIPITTLVVFCASLAVVFILDKIPILNKYIM